MGVKIEAWRVDYNQRRPQSIDSSVVGSLLFAMKVSWPFTRAIQDPPVIVKI